MPLSIQEARMILGLGPDQDPRPHLERLRETRVHLAGLAKDAATPELRKRYEKHLSEFDEALAEAIAYLKALGLDTATTGPADHGVEVSVDLPEPKRRKRRSNTPAVLVLILAIGALCHAAVFFGQRQREARKSDERIALLETLGAEFVSSRRWQDATRAYREIDELIPGSEIARLGLSAVAAGRQEEETQFIAYWSGQTLAELEAGRLDAASAALRNLLDRHPENPEAKDLDVRIQKARKEMETTEKIQSIRKLAEAWKWPEAVESARRLSSDLPNHPAVASLLEEMETGARAFEANRQRANELHLMASERNIGQFDQQALDWLQEAASLDPANQSVRELLEKMSSYTRTLRVPEDFPTPQAAIDQARARDRIVIAKGEWHGPITIHAPIELAGAGSRLTVISCPASVGCPVTIQAESGEARISGIAFRHESLVVEPGERFSVATVVGGKATFVDCSFSMGNGHGLAVTAGATATARRCQFRDNAWNGAAAIGEGAALALDSCESRDNFHNGVEAWDGAGLDISQCTISGNTRNGIHLDSPTATVHIENNRLTANREFGILLSSASKGDARGNTIRQNLLGGIFIRTRASSVTVVSNECSANEGPGIALQRGISRDGYANNTLRNNRGPAILTDIEP